MPNNGIFSAYQATFIHSQLATLEALRPMSSITSIGPTARPKSRAASGLFLDLAVKRHATAKIGIADRARVLNPNAVHHEIGRDNVQALDALAQRDQRAAEFLEGVPQHIEAITLGHDFCRGPDLRDAGRDAGRLDRLQQFFAG